MPLPREAKVMSPGPAAAAPGGGGDIISGGGRGSEIEGMAQFLRKALRIEGPQLNPKTVTIRYFVINLFRYYICCTDFFYLV